MDSAQKLLEMIESAMAQKGWSKEEFARQSKASRSALKGLIEALKHGHRCPQEFTVQRACVSLGLDWTTVEPLYKDFTDTVCQRYVRRTYRGEAHDKNQAYRAVTIYLPETLYKRVRAQGSPSAIVRALLTKEYQEA